MRDSFEPLNELVAQVRDTVTSHKDPLLPYIGLEHLERGRSSVTATSQSEESISTNFVFKAGDILFGKLRPNLQKSVRVNFDGYCSTDLIVLRARDYVDPSYAGWIMRSSIVFSEAVRTAEGTKMPRTSWERLQGLPVYAPSLRQQHQIAEVLNTVDEQIMLGRRLIRKIEKAESRVVDLFLQNLKIRLGSGAIRHDSMETHSSPGRPFLRTGPFGSSLKGEDWTSEGVPVVTIAALADGYIDSSRLYFVSQRKAASLQDYSLCDGDILFSRVADIGRSAVVGRNQSGMIMSSNLMRISLDVVKAVPNYVQLIISRYTPLREQIRRLANASGREVINDEIMRGLKFPWIERSHQVQLVNLVAEFNASAEKERKALTKLRLLRDALMGDLLTGRVPVDAGQRA